MPGKLEAARRPGELVPDIGVGEGALTAHLVRAQARVIAVELDPRRASVLRGRFPGITVAQADAAAVPLPGRSFRVVANPPYGISASLLRTLLAPGSRLVAADLILQRAVVRKYAARTARGFSLAAGLTLPWRAVLPELPWPCRASARPRNAPPLSGRWPAFSGRRGRRRSAFPSSPACGPPVAAPGRHGPAWRAGR